MTSQPPRQPESRLGDLQEGEAASFSSEWANGGYVNGAGDYGITTCLTVITDVGKRELSARLMLSYSYDDRSSSAGVVFDTDDGGNNVFVLWWVLVQGWSELHTHTGANTHTVFTLFFSWIRMEVSDAVCWHIKLLIVFILYKWMIWMTIASSKLYNCSSTYSCCFL